MYITGINNINVIRRRMYMLILLSAVVAIMLVFSFFIEPFLGLGIVFKVFMSIMLLFLLFRFYKQTCFLYENSGEVVTIKAFHPIMQNVIGPKMEFPIRYLRRFYLEKAIIGYKLILVLKTRNEYEIRRKFILTGFLTSQIQSITRSLEETLNRNNA